MFKFSINRLWRTRIAGVAALVSFAVLALFGLGQLSETLILPGSGLVVAPITAGLAALTLTLAAASHFFTPKKHAAFVPFFCYTMLVATTTHLIFTTGELGSFFVWLWLPAVIFGGIFGTVGLTLPATLPIAYLGWLYAFGSLTPSTIIVGLLAGEVPVLLSYYIFPHHSDEKGDDRAYRQLENEFSQVSGKAEVVINAITNGVLALNSQGIIQLINPAAEQLLGWSRRDALKLDYKSVLRLTDLEGKELVPAADPVANTLATNESTRSEDLVLLTNSDKKLFVSIVVSPAGSPGSGVIVVFRDITKEKAEEREQAEFVSTASHEMRTPVASIEGYLGLALNPATAQIDEKARDYITKAHEVAQHLGRLFQDLLDVTKAEDGRLSNNPRIVDVVAFVQGIVEGLQPKAKEKGLVMLFKPLPDGEEEDKAGTRRLNPVFYVNVDNDHLREVVSNLVENAIKYTPSGTVSIDIGGDEKTVEISVEDTGIGIPPEDLSHLFQKFYRVDSSDTREIGGTGLGLYLTRRLAETMGGRVSVESQYKQGSTFTVSLPRTGHQEAMQLIESGGEPEAITPEPSRVPLQSPLAQAAAPTAPVQAAPVNSEPVYANPAPADIAAQLSTEHPLSTPAAYIQVPPADIPPNPSLESIEQNPREYLRRTAPTAVPPQNQDQP